MTWNPLCRRPPAIQQLCATAVLLAFLSSLPFAASAQRPSQAAEASQTRADLRTGSAPQIPQPPEIVPSFQPPPESVGDALASSRHYQAAIEIYKKIPNLSADGWNKMGVAYQVLHDSKDAERCFKESLRIRPEHAMTFNDLGAVYDSQGKHSEAERMYRHALALDSDLPVAIMNLGTNLIAQGKTAEGSEMYRRAVALAPDLLDGAVTAVTTMDVRLHQKGATDFFKAKAFAQKGMTDRSIKYLRRAIGEGFITPGTIAQDSSFARINGTAAFQRFISEETAH
jgi:tetratricopeptide (TPR) repeat protein